jgi:hypothetical protein
VLFCLFLILCSPTKTSRFAGWSLSGNVLGIAGPCQGGNLQVKGRESQENYIFDKGSYSLNPVTYLQIILDFLETKEYAF